MKGNTSGHLHETKRSHHTGTHSAIAGHNKALHCVHGHL